MADIELDFIADINEALSDVRRFQKEISNSTSGMKKSFDGVNVSLLNINNAISAARNGYAVVKGAIDTVLGTISKFTTAASQQEDAVNRLTASMKLNGDYTDEARQQMLDFASQMQDVTTVGDEASIAMLSLAKSMGATNDQAIAVVRAAINLSEATGGKVSLQSAVVNVGKTLGGLTGELGEILPQLKTLTAAQLKAGKGIELVDKQFAGFAENTAKTFSGQVKQLSNAVGDLYEELGFVITQSGEASSGLSGLLDIVKSLSSFVRENRKVFQDLIKSIVSFAIEAYKIFDRVSAFITEVIGRVFQAAGFVAQGGLLGKVLGDLNPLKKAGEYLDDIGGSLIDNAKSAEEVRKKLDEVKDTLFSSTSSGNGLKVAADKLENLKKETHAAAVLTKEELSKLQSELESFKTKFKDSGKTQVEIIQDNNRQVMSQLEKFYTQSLIDEKEYSEFRLRIEKDTTDKLENIALQQQKNRLTNVGRGLVETISGGIESVGFQEFTEIGAGLALAFSNGINGAKSFVVEAGRAVGDIWFGAFGDAIAALLENLSAPADEFIAKLTQGFQEFPNIILNILNNIPNLLLVVSKELPKMITRILSDDFPNFIEEFIAAIPEIIEAIIDALPMLIEALITSLPRLIVGIVNGIIRLFASFFDISAKRWNINMAKTIEVWNSGIVQSVKNWIEGAQQSSINFAKNILDGAVGFIGKIIDGAGDFIKELINKLQGAVTSPISKVTSAFGGIPTPPNPFGFSEGGVVPGGPPFTDKVPAMLTPGEAVLTRDQVKSLVSANNSSAGVAQNLTVVVRVAEQDLAKAMLVITRNGLRTA